MGDPRPFLSPALTDAAANQDHLSDDRNDESAIGRPFVTGFNKFLAIQASWSGVSGAPSGVLTVEHSADGVEWHSHDKHKILLEPGESKNEIEIDRLPQQYWRIRYEKNGVVAGTLSCQVYSY